MKINEKNLCTFACTPPVDLEGTLSKRGDRSWNTRWFVLKGNLLFYFEKRGDKEPLGVIILEGCTIEMTEEDGEQYCFKVIFHGEKDRSYLLAAESQDVMEKWMKALTCAGYEYMKLMVAELQRQLEELESSQSSDKDKGTSSAGRNGRGSDMERPAEQQQPKAPPRRHNPFNRPGMEVNGQTRTEDVTIRKKDYSIPRQEPTQMKLVSASSSSGPQPNGPATTSSSSAAAAGMTTTSTVTHCDGNEPQQEEEGFSFGTLHAALGQSFVQERLRRRQEQEDMARQNASPSPLPVAELDTNLKDQKDSINSSISMAREEDQLLSRGSDDDGGSPKESAVRVLPS